MNTPPALLKNIGKISPLPLPELEKGQDDLRALWKGTATTSCKATYEHSGRAQPRHHARRLTSTLEGHSHDIMQDDGLLEHVLLLVLLGYHHKVTEQQQRLLVLPLQPMVDLVLLKHVDLHNESAMWSIWFLQHEREGRGHDSPPDCNRSHRRGRGGEGERRRGGGVR